MGRRRVWKIVEGVRWKSRKVEVGDRERGDFNKGEGREEVRF